MGVVGRGTARYVSSQIYNLHYYMSLTVELVFHAGLSDDKKKKTVELAETYCIVLGTRNMESN